MGGNDFHIIFTINLFTIVLFLFFLHSLTARKNARTQEERQTPIHYASKNNAVESIKVLLNYGANINDRDYRARTPLYLAAENGMC